jgi:hypothetical protein
MHNKKGKKRPVLVWLISVFFFIFTALGLLSMYLFYSGIITPQP